MADKDLKSITPDTSPALTNYVFGADSQAAIDPTLWLMSLVMVLFSKSINALVFYPADNEPPAANYATLDTRNGHPVLDFDTTTAEAAIFTGILPRSYGGGGVTVEVGYSMTSATAGTCGWTVEFERIGDSQQDIDSDSFASAQTITAVTVPGTSGHVDVVSVNVTDGANMDSVAAGEMFRVRVKRDVANDDAAGDAELNWVRVRET